MNNGELINAISEERINRIKNWYGIPMKSVETILKRNNLKYSDIDFFVTSGISVKDKSVPNYRVYSKKIIQIKKSKLSKKQKFLQIKFLKKRMKHEDNVINKRTRSILKKLNKKFKNLLIYDHHLSHAASACVSSGFKKCYCLTIDGWGDNSSAKILKFAMEFLMKFPLHNHGLTWLFLWKYYKVIRI